MFRPSLKITLLASVALTSWVSLAYSPPQGVDGKLGAMNSTLTQTFKNWGLINSEAKSHINILNAWKLQEGSPKVLVAVIDTGIDAGHPDLQKNIWKDPNRTSQTFGWNFVSNTANPRDEHGHGTHVSGIIGATANSRAGVAGVAHRVSIMGVKYYSDANTGAVNLRNTVKAINYAVDHGAKIINYSGGGPEFSEEEYLAIKRAEARGVLVVAAAGNEHQDTDRVENYYYPSAYRLTNIISVAATNIHNQLLPSSNWGKTKVDVAAPGENIYSTLPRDRNFMPRYGYMTGTSQATAFVSGLAALLLSENPKLTPPQLKEIILKSVDRVPSLAGKLATGGRINAYAALLALKDTQVLPGRDALVARRPVSLMPLLTPSEE